MINNLMTILLFASLLAISSCNDEKCDELILHLESLECENQICSLDLKDLFPEPWDQLYIFHGFSTPEDISSAIGFYYSGEAIYDHTRLILEISDNKILKVTKTECLSINLDKVLRNGYYNKDVNNSVITISILSDRESKKYVFEN